MFAKIAVITTLFLFCFHHAQALTLSSNDIAEGQPLKNTFVYKGFGCDGKNQSPQLAWSDVPKGTQSFALTVHDPDAPTDSGWWHWIVINIPKDVRELSKDASTSGKLASKSTHLRNDFGDHHYSGACPPAGEVHRYKFTLYALPVKNLNIGANASAAMASFVVKSKALQSSSITAIYTR